MQNAQFQRARQPNNFRSSSGLLDHVRNALDGELPCPLLLFPTTIGGRSVSRHSFDFDI